MDEQLTPPEAVPPRDPPWGILEALPIAVSAIALTGLVIAALPPGASLLVLMVFPLLLAGLTLGWTALRHRGSRAALRLRSERPGRDIAYGAISGVVLYFVAMVVLASLAFLITLITGDAITPPRQLDLPAALTRGDVAILIVSLVVAAPFGEELFFRGFLFRAMRRRWRRLAAVLSSAVFALFHVLPILLLPLFVVGLGLAWLYESRGSLVAPMTAHAVFNSIGLFVLLSVS